MSKSSVYSVFFPSDRSEYKQFSKKHNCTLAISLFQFRTVKCLKVTFKAIF